ncbi:hypothetical protein B0T18DRAFT_412905 [Schizothecium vesticola]|uniref:Uncharacterized protein n=1 Tax=Schizothecium vesticola TaxID=314040 RepID=A0AA40EX89_9PEZI|nr:hypothetical protein B0T18DRAFT_412905 [Schizothecium vesticola]
MTELYMAANEAVGWVPEEERKKVEADWMDSVRKQGNQEFWGWKEESTLPDIIRFRSAEKIFVQDSIWDFEILLLHTKNFKATNPVDRIYGILGLADDIGEDEDDFAPSYERDQTLKVVMRRFAAGLIRRGKCPAVLAFAGIHDGNDKAPNAWLLRAIDWVHSQQYDLASWFSAPGIRRTPNRTRIPSVKPQPLSWKDELQILPSWVPDWVTVRHSTTTTMQFNLEGVFKNERGERLYHAALDTTPVVEVDEARDTLRIKGRCFDTLAFVFPDEMTTCPIWYETIARFVIGTQYPTREPLVEAIWRTMVANRTFDAERAPASFGDDYAYLQNLDAIKVFIFALVPVLFAVLGALLVAYYPLRFRPDNYYTFTAIFIIAQVVTLPPSFQHDWRLVRGIPTVAVWLHWSVIMVLILTVLARWVYRSRRWLVQHVLVPFGPTTIMMNSASLARPTKNWGFSNALALTSTKYSFCLTDKRRLTALVPLSAREGDQLAVFYGCGAPFVIRRHEAFGFYRLIGEAYVHGAMDGGVMRDETCVDEMFALR